MDFEINEAEPIDVKIKIGIAGPQASGKTTSALRIATGIVSVTGGRILVIDTENKRALTYANDFEFQHMNFDPPFSPDRYLQALRAADKADYGPNDIIIIDSMSHEHEGPGGVLEMVEQFLDNRAGKDFTKRDRLTMAAWAATKKERVKTIQHGIQRINSNIILCFRAKEKSLPKKVNGKLQMIPMGVQPIGGPEYFYEMNVTFILPEGSNGAPDWTQSASRINEYGDGPLKKGLHGIQQISEQTGALIAGKDAIEYISESEAGMIVDMANKAGAGHNSFLNWIGAESFQKITRKDLQKAHDALQKKMEAKTDA